MAEKLCEHTYGTHIFMRIKLDSGQTEEVDAFLTSKGWTYRTTADRTPRIRLQVIAAFHTLY